MLLILDGAGWHKSYALRGPDDITLLHLPLYAREAPHPLKKSPMPWFRDLTGFAETDYAATRSQLLVEGERLRSLVNGRCWKIGRLEMPSLAELRERAKPAMVTMRGALRVRNLTADAHAAGLKVVVWTFRAENLFLPAQYRRGTAPADHGDLSAYLKTFYALGVDAVFSDFPGVAVAAR